MKYFGMFMVVPNLYGVIRMKEICILMFLGIVQSI